MSNAASRIFLWLQCLVLSIFLTACGGGASGGSGGGVNVSAPGIGSGGTGVSFGPITGFGSIVVDDVHYDIDGITPLIEDAAELKLGMVVRVTGAPVASSGTMTATSVSTAAELRGAVGAIDLAAQTFEVLGVTVSTDNATIYDGFVSLNTLGVGQFVQVNGLPLGSGGLRATRIEKIAVPAELITTGPVNNLNAASNTFNIGATTMNFASSELEGMSRSELANGLMVRVRGQLSGGEVVARKVQRWQAAVAENGVLSSSGVISGYTSISGTFNVSGIVVNASSAAVTGGNPNTVGNGVKVDVEGTMINGVLQANKLKIRHIPGAGNLPSFSAEGKIVQFLSPSSFRVKGQKIDASQPGVVFVNGTSASLAQNVSVSIIGTQVVDDVLIATQVTF